MLEIVPLEGANPSQGLLGNKPGETMSSDVLSSLKNPYAKFLDKVEKPARYIGGEKFIIRKSWEKLTSKIALCFADTYEIGMSHLGFKILYDELNKIEGMAAERVFTPWLDMEEMLREKKLPLVSLENFKPLNEFDILGFSLQYEMSYTNILNMLDLGNVPVWQKDRTEQDPFVIAGGPCATHPEPLAPFIDFFVIGDGEELFARLAWFVGKKRQEGMARKEILKSLSEWEGIYVPSLFETKQDPNTGFEIVQMDKKIKRFFVESLKDFPIPTKSPVSHLTAVFDRYSVELSRGCTEGCRFCQAGMIYRPVRERRPTDVIEAFKAGVKNGGFDEASLTCLSTADYSAITPLLLQLLDDMKKEKTSLGISSLRAYGLDNRIFDKMAEVKNTSLTFAPEAGTERMRKVINKNISEKDLLETAENIFTRGWSKMKLYFMIGLPTETDEDVFGIMETAAKARRVAKKCGVSNPSITVSVSTFVPKPHTPFQWHAMIPYHETETKQENLFKLSRKFKLNFRKHLSKTSFMEGIVARGDRPIANVIFDAWKSGAKFDGWNEGFKFDLWMEALEKNQIDVQKYLGTIRMDGELPWNHIDVGLHDGFLEREWKRALKDRLSLPCGKPPGAIVHHSNLEALEKTHDKEKKKLVCYHCGVACDLTQMVDERRDYLSSLDAIKNEPYVKPDHINLNLADRREKRGQNYGFKYRIGFSKLGPLSFISHLDLQKVMMRVFKRSNIEMLYSEGFNQRPLISLGPALSLGISSCAEFLDIRVPNQWHDTDKILQLLSENSEKGLYFSSVEELTQKSHSIQEAVTGYKFFLPLKEKGEIETILSDLNKASEITIESFNKKKKQFFPKDIKPVIDSMKLTTLDLSNDMIEVIDEVSPCKNLLGVSIKTKVQKGVGIRPGEIQQLFISKGVSVEKPIKTGVFIR